MAWNEPGKDKDPWKNDDKGKDQGPPDLDVVLRKLSAFVAGLFGKKLSGGSGKKRRWQ